MAAIAGAMGRLRVEEDAKMDMTEVQIDRRDGKAPGLELDVQYAAVALLATRKIIDNQREAELRKLIDTARLGARPDEVIDAPEMDPRRREVAEAYVHWLHEWREVARVAINRRDFRIALGLAQRRQSSEEGDATEETTAVSATN